MQFGVVGASGFAVNLVVYAMCLKVFSLHYLASAVVAFGVAVTNNFFWNRPWTFRHRRDRRHAALQGARFLFVSALALVPNLIILHVFVERRRRARCSARCSRSASSCRSASSATSSGRSSCALLVAPAARGGGRRRSGRPRGPSATAVGLAHPECPLSGRP